MRGGSGWRVYFPCYYFFAINVLPTPSQTWLIVLEDAIAANGIFADKYQLQLQPVFIVSHHNNNI